MTLVSTTERSCRYRMLASPASEVLRRSLARPRTDTHPVVQVPRQSTLQDAPRRSNLNNRVTSRSWCRPGRGRSRRHVVASDQMRSRGFNLCDGIPSTRVNERWLCAPNPVANHSSCNPIRWDTSAGNGRISHRVSDIRLCGMHDHGGSYPAAACVVTMYGG
jgi:hypothetical protein